MPSDSTQPDDSPKSQAPIYFFGCDMGGWQNDDKGKGDALAVCKWLDGECQHVEATANVLFFPVGNDGVLAERLREALSEEARVIVAIDAALGWPTDYVKLVSEASSGIRYDQRTFDKAINNPYLYRETERFIRAFIRKDRDPLTAPGDKFGNNSSKAQMLVAWFREQLPNAYRPPFDDWALDAARSAKHTLIEVYPDASRKSKPFSKLKWPAFGESMADAGNKDIADARICAMTGVCYAMQVGMIDNNGTAPPVCCPDDERISDEAKKRIASEGWIFAPELSLRKATGQ